MNPFNTILYDENIRRQISLTRNKNGLRRSSLTVLREHDLEYAKRFENAFLRLSSNDLGKLRQATQFNTERLTEFRSVIESLGRSSFRVFSDAINPDLDQLTIDEFAFQENLVRFAAAETETRLPVIKSATNAKLRRYRSLEPMVDTTQDDFLRNWAAGRSDKVLRAVRRGLKRGLNQEEILRSIYGTQRRFSGILKATHQGAGLASNTLHVSATSAANCAFVSLNDGFDLLVSAILDSGSSKICVSNHNQFIFEDLEGDRSPYHPNCNTRVFVYMSGDEPPARESFMVWWDRQTDEVKLEFLGRTRFEAQQENPERFRDPRIFISTEGDNFITIDELRDTGVLG